MLIIVNWLTEIIHYKPVKLTMNVQDLVKVIIKIIMRHHSISDAIVTD